MDVTEKAHTILKMLESADPPYTLKQKESKEQSIFDYYWEKYEQ